MTPRYPEGWKACAGDETMNKGGTRKNVRCVFDMILALCTDEEKTKHNPPFTGWMNNTVLQTSVVTAWECGALQYVGHEAVDMSWTSLFGTEPSCALCLLRHAWQRLRHLMHVIMYTRVVLVSCYSRHQIYNILCMKKAIPPTYSFLLFFHRSSSTLLGLITFMSRYDSPKKFHKHPLCGPLNRATAPLFLCVNKQRWKPIGCIISSCGKPVTLLPGPDFIVHKLFV